MQDHYANFIAATKKGSHMITYQMLDLKAYRIVFHSMRREMLQSKDTLRDALDFRQLRSIAATAHNKGA